MRRRQRTAALVATASLLAALTACADPPSRWGTVVPATEPASLQAPEPTPLIPQWTSTPPVSATATSTDIPDTVLWRRPTRDTYLGRGADGTFVLKTPDGAYQGVNPHTGTVVWTIPATALPGAVAPYGQATADAFADGALFVVTIPVAAPGAATPAAPALSRFEPGATHPTWSQPLTDLGFPVNGVTLSLGNFGVAQGVVVVGESDLPGHIARTVGLSDRTGRQLWTSPRSVYAVDGMLWADHGPVDPLTAADRWAPTIDTSGPQTVIRAHDGLVQTGPHTLRQLSDGTPIALRSLAQLGTPQTIDYTVCGWDADSLVTINRSNLVGFSRADPTRITWTATADTCTQLDDGTIVLTVSFGYATCWAIDPASGDIRWRAHDWTLGPNTGLGAVAVSDGVVLVLPATGGDEALPLLPPEPGDNR